MRDALALVERSGDDSVHGLLYANLVAVAIEGGLFTPVIRDAHLMSLAELEQSVLHYALKARAGKRTIDEMTGGTFTISNGKCCP